MDHSQSFHNITLNAMSKAVTPSASQYTSYILLVALIVLGATYLKRAGTKPLPEFNPRKALEFTDTRRLRAFMRNSIELLTIAREQFGSRPFKLYCDWGEVIVLPPSAINELKSNKLFEFSLVTSDDIHGYLPGFDPLMQDPAVPKVVTKYLTKALTKVTAPLSEEAALVIEEVIGDKTDWHELCVQRDIMTIVSRMSSRVFMGQELGRDPEWNAASANYTMKAFATGETLRTFPRWSRPFVHWFMPSCWEVRRALSEARRTIQPHVERRAKIKAEALARGEKSPLDDSIEWLEQAGARLDPATGQIALSLVAIHTTSDLLQQTMLRLAQHPALFQPLRDEIVSVLKADGLKKTALYNLKLMDSVLKETQRLKPMIIGWKRGCLEDTTLSSGFTIKKGQKIMIASTHMWHDDYYPEAESFDGYRFVRMRDSPGGDHMAHLVSTSNNHLGFGHGIHACPGRFFASNEIKIALCHLLLKYDWQLCDGTLRGVVNGMSYVSDPAAKLLIRRREEELDISSLEC